MNNETVSQLFFDERYTVPVDQTAPAVFAALPHGAAYASRLVDAMATASLVAVLESLCLRELHACVDGVGNVIVGTGVQVRHRAPIPAGAQLRVTGWVERIGEREATFRVQAHDGLEEVCEASVHLAIVARRDLEARVARRHALRGRPHAAAA